MTFDWTFHAGDVAILLVFVFHLGISYNDIRWLKLAHKDMKEQFERLQIRFDRWIGGGHS